MKKILLIIIIVMITAGFCLFSVLTGVSDNLAGEVIVKVPKGAGAAAIGRSLAEGKIVKNYLNFRLASFLLGADKKMQAGSYRLSSSMPLYEIVLKLKQGETTWERVTITFPEGTSIYKMGVLLEEAGVAWGSQFKILAESANVPYFAQEFPFLKNVKLDSLEGYLYPDTYVFAKNISAEVLAKLMLKRYAEVVIPFWVEQGAKATEYDLNQIMTLASIIEKEAAVSSERAIISSVFHNRLDRDMTLSACPTIKYALDNPTKTVYYYQLKVRSPFNTYTQKGLPPGPICNPGIESIKAAVYPAKTDYYFFVSNNDGTHTFKKTFTPTR